MTLFEGMFKDPFHVHGGRTLANLQELADYLPLMDEEQFAHHVTKEKNDFATWAEHHEAPPEIVEGMRSATTRDELVHALQEARDGIHESIDDDDQFNQVKEQYAERNEKIQEKFDTVVSDMKEAIANELPDELQKVEDDLKDRYDETRAKISDLRREGKDMLIPSLELRRFPAIFAYAHASREKKDYEDAEHVLDKVKVEMDEAAKAVEVNIKKEVLELAGEGLKTAEADATEER